MEGSFHIRLASKNAAAQFQSLYRIIQIRLTNSAIPVKFLESEAEAVMPTDHVIQNKGVFALVDRVDIAKILERDSDEPLARIRLTKFVKLGATAIGFSQHHSIGMTISFHYVLRRNADGCLP